MSIELESAARLAALRDKANAATGENAGTLAGAVDALIAGFGSGSGGDVPENALLVFTDYDETGLPRTLIYNCPDIFTQKDLFYTNAAFSGWFTTALKRVIMPDTVTTISDKTFIGLSGIEELSNWDSISYIGESAFFINNGTYDKGKKLQHTTFPPNLTYIGNNAFRRNLVNIADELPDKLTVIGSSAFHYGGNRNWEITKLPPNLISIGNAAFWCYRKLLITEIPASVDYIGQYAFDGQYDKTSLTLIKFRGVPSTVMDGAFRNNDALTDIYVPWEEGAVANSPWGATNAKIHYSTTYDADGNPIV